MRSLLSWIRRPRLLPFTVVFIVDGNHGVEAFTAHVSVASAADAFDAAVSSVRESEQHICSRYELDDAKEIVTYAGHLNDA